MKKHRCLQTVNLLALALVIAAFLLPMPVSAASIDLEDGEYSVEVTLEGGSGRSTVVSPATLIVQDGKAQARIEWSSRNYDYMVVDGVKYLPITTDPHSVFEIPVSVLGEPMAVTADTTAMSVPHEVEYTLTFLKPKSDHSMMRLAVCTAGVVAGGAILIVKKKGNP